MYKLLKVEIISPASISIPARAPLITDFLDLFKIGSQDNQVNQTCSFPSHSETKNSL